MWWWVSVVDKVIIYKWSYDILVNLVLFPPDKLDAVKIEILGFTKYESGILEIL